MTPPSPRRRLLLTTAAVAVLASPLAVALPAHASTVRNEIVYTADADNDNNYGLVLRDLESRTVRVLLPEDRVRETIYDDPELSPNGDRIAFSTDRSAGPLDEGIAVINRNGTGFRRLTNPPAATDTSYTIDVAPAWSPDGSRLLFTRIRTVVPAVGDATVTTALHVVPAAGGAVTAVPNAADGYTGDWSPDGTSIVFVALPADGDTGPITVMRPDGTGRRGLPGANGLFPAWSPDGSTIAFSRVTSLDTDRNRAHDVTQIATVPVAGGPVTTLAATRPTSARTVAGYPTWSPDGQSLLFDLFGYSTTDDFPPGDVWAVDPAGVRAGRVTTDRGDETQAHAQGPALPPVSPGGRSTYTPVTPQRVLDTRDGTGVRAGKVGPGGVIDLAVRGLPTRPAAVPATATAVVLNVTLTAPTSRTTVTAFPSGTSAPLASNLNASQPGATVPNLVTTRIGDNGRISLRNAFGSSHLIADIAGYYTPDEAGLGFQSLAPSRVLDTRFGVGAPARPVGRAGTLDLRVTGTLPTFDGGTVTVPATARAVVLNVTGTGTTGSTDVRVYPTPATGTEFPVVSNLNLRQGQTAANLVTVAVGDGGRVRLRNREGTVQLIADIAGYYAEEAPGRFVPVAPTRFLDTRSGTGAAPIPTTRGATVDLRIAGRRGVPSSATVAVVNVTGTAVTATTDVRAYPPTTATAFPTVSNLNLVAGDTRANLAVVRLAADGRLRLRNGAGQLELVADLAGYMVD